MTQHEIRLREHMLNRLGYGGTPEERELYASLGAEAWIDRQVGWEAVHPPLDPWFDSPQELAEAAIGIGTSTVARALTVERTLTRMITDKHSLGAVLRDFWFNHFNVTAFMGIAKHQLDDYLDTAITPYMFSTFEQMLSATAKHPAMLHYLDNKKNHAEPTVAVVTYADGSGKDVPVGPNQNFARELLELHTLGVDGGYNQLDVLETTRVLSGHSTNFEGKTFEAPLFRDTWHDYGTKQILDTTYPRPGTPPGAIERDQLFNDLSLHHATRQHVCGKLAVRFVGEGASKYTIQRAADTWADTGGDLQQVMRSLLTAPQLAEPQTMRARLKPPHRYIASAYRTLGVEPGPDLVEFLTGEMLLLGDAPFFYGPPTGYPDHYAFWLTGDGMLARAQIAQAIANDPAVLDAIGPLVAVQTVESTVASLIDLALPAGVSSLTSTAVSSAVERARREPSERVPTALELLLVSPEFMRY